MGKSLNALTDSFANGILFGFFGAFATNAAMSARGGEMTILETIILGTGITLASTFMQYPFYRSYYSKKEKNNYDKF